MIPSIFYIILKCPNTMKLIIFTSILKSTLIIVYYSTTIFAYDFKVTQIIYHSIIGITISKNLTSWYNTIINLVSFRIVFLKTMIGHWFQIKNNLILYHRVPYDLIVKNGSSKMLYVHHYYRGLNGRKTNFHHNYLISFFINDLNI